MVKTLFKYEFKAYARTLLPMQGVLIVIALVNRLVQFMENDHFSYDIAFGSSLAALIISMLFLVVFTFIFGITRYYKNMFSHEGYLTLTLPVTPRQHIFVKLVTLVAFTFITLCAMAAAGCVATAGEMLYELLGAAGYLFKYCFSRIGWHLVLYIVELIVTTVLFLAVQYMIFYACMTLGQTARKSRVLFSFAIYFIYYLITQVLFAVLAIVFISLAESGNLDWLTNFAFDHKLLFYHLLLCFVSLIMICFGALLYFITHSVLKNRLNLE